MITEIVVADRHDTINQILKVLRADVGQFKTIDYIYVIDKQENLVGVISIKILFKYSKQTKLEDIMITRLITVSPDTDQEKVADLAVKHDLKAVPIVVNKKILGVVPIENILPILNKALREDILHLAGIHKAHLNYENTLAVPLFQGILHRIPWLLIGLLGISLSALFINTFESELQKYLIIAFFIPAIVYMSDALGTQHQTLFIRDLAIMGKDLKLKAYFIKEMLIGSILAGIIGFILFLIISFFWKQPYIAFVVSLAMTITLIITSFSALAITLLIQKLKMDPALGSGPFATIISDMSSIFVYFLIVFLLLG